MQAAEDGDRDHPPDAQNGAPRWRILSQSQMAARLIVVVSVRSGFSVVPFGSGHRNER